MLKYLAQTAVGGDDPSGIGIPNLDEGDVVTILERAGVWMFWVFLIVAVIMVLISAFRYLAASGKEEGIRTATHSLIYAVSAMAVALLAWSFTALIANLLGA